MELIGITKNAHKKYNCDYCDYSCSYKRDWNRHILSAKHQNWANGINLELKCPKNAQFEKKQYICVCGKEYNTQSGLWKHKKNCVNDNYDNEITSDKKENTILKNTDMYDKELIMILVKQNTELLEIIKNGTNNNINSNNNNKTFNLQVFLNETCKDAMNLSEFIDNISLQLSDLENMGKLGYVEGVSNIIIKNLNALEVEKRPMHCTDKKREIVYIKDDDEWQKEQEDKKHIKSMISSVVSKNLELLAEYENKYPECMNPESKKSDEYNKIIMETMAGGGNTGEKNKEKILRKIAKEVVIEKIT
jgi:hypothetical protein